MKKNDSESKSFDEESQSDTIPEALSEEVSDRVDLEFSEEIIKEDQEVNFNKNYILLGIIIFVAIAGSVFAFVNQSNIQNSDASQNQELDTSPVTTVASQSAISEAMKSLDVGSVWSDCSELSLLLDAKLPMVSKEFNLL